jgi:hypothetical protein
MCLIVSPRGKLMYIAEHSINGRKNYFIRVSHYDPAAKCWKSKDLYNLGRKPWDYVVYPGGNAFHIDEAVISEIVAQGVECDLCELEELFWKFIKKDIRLKLEPFHCRGLRAKGKNVTPVNTEDQQVQIFDKRRLYYLRTGVVDQKRINSLPLKYFKGLISKSRDEIEQYIMQHEKNIKPNEYKQYVYVSFDLQRHFVAHSARLIPQALSQDELDKCFLQDLCELQGDESFWAGFQQQDRLHEYLVRYAVMFFDYEFDGGSAWEEYLQDFINAKRFFRPPSRTTVSMTEVVEIFEMPEEELSAMDKAELTKLFRRRAHELHPDKGGEHDDFVRLSEAYEQLIQRKG